MLSFRKRLLLPLFSATIAASLTLGGCASSTTPTSDNLRMQAELTSTLVSGNYQKGGTIQAQGLTLTITSMKVLVSEIKLDAKSDGSEIKFKDKAAILSVDSTGGHLTSAGTIPGATYNKVSIKFHRLNDDERLSLATDPNFADFGDNDRNSVIIKGYVTENGVATPFTFGGRLDETIKLNMADVTVTADGQTVIALQADPIVIFKDNSSKLVLDPRAAGNHAIIEAALKAAFKAYKK